MSGFRTPALLVTGALAFGSGLAAQQRDTVRTDTLVYRIDEIRVEAVRPVTTIGGASAFEIRVDQLRLGAAPTVEQVLREIPSVHVRTNSRGESEVSIRGSESRQVAVLVDGVPITMGWDGRTDLSVLPATAPSEVSVVRGLSSILHGPNVLGGVVEMSVGRGSEFPAESAFSIAAGSETTGAYSTAASASIPLEGAGGLWLLRAGAGFRDSPGQALAEGVTEPVPTANELRLNTDMTNVDGFLAVRHERDSGAWFTFAGSTFKAERGIAAELDSPAPRLWRYPEIRRTILASSAGTGDRGTPIGRGDLEVSIGLDLGRTEIRSYATRSYDEIDATEDGEDRTATLRLLGDHTLGSRGDLRSAFTYSIIDHEAIIDGVSKDYQQKLLSFGAETVWRLVERPNGALEALRISAGGAYDRGETPKSGGLPAVRAQGDWGARLGLTALINSGGTLLHMGASRRGRFPALRETYSESLSRFEANPDLRPERLLAFEGGVTTRIGAGGELQLVGFRHGLSGAIRRITLPDGRRKRVNSERLESTGIEMLASKTFGGVGIGGELTLQTVELLDPASTATSRRPENVPERSGSAYLRLPVPGGISAQLGARHTGPQFCLHLDTGEDVELDAGTLLNGDVSRTWSLGSRRSGAFTRLQTSVSVDNLTDAALYDQCGLPRPGRVFGVRMRIF